MLLTFTQRNIESNPEGCDSETKSVEGDDEQDSVWSLIHPPASSFKRSNRKGKTPPKKNKSNKNAGKVVLLYNTICAAYSLL